MILSEFVSLLQLRLGSRDDLATRIKTEVPLVQATTLEGTGAFLPWFLQTSTSNLSTIAGDSEVALPADFLAEIEDNTLWYQDADSNWHKLIKKSVDYTLEKALDSGAPKYYSVGADAFIIAPVPDAIYTLRYRYYARAATLTADGDTNLWLAYAADLLLAEVGYVMAKYHIQDDVIAAKFQMDAATARQRVFTKHEAIQSVNRVYGMGED